jgi:hypothetical protein
MLRAAPLRPVVKRVGCPGDCRLTIQTGDSIFTMKGVLSGVGPRFFAVVPPKRERAALGVRVCGRPALQGAILRLCASINLGRTVSLERPIPAALAPGCLRG